MSQLKQGIGVLLWGLMPYFSSTFSKSIFIFKRAKSSINYYFISYRISLVSQVLIVVPIYLHM